MTGREVYTLALSLMSEKDSGGFDHSDISDYEKNAPAIISVLLPEIWCETRGLKKGGAREPDCCLGTVTSLDETLPIEDAFALAPLSYALASMLIYDEDRTKSDHLYNMYQKSLKNLKRSFSKANHSSIKDIYK